MKKEVILCDICGNQTPLEFGIDRSPIGIERIARNQERLRLVVLPQHFDGEVFSPRDICIR